LIAGLGTYCHSPASTPAPSYPTMLLVKFDSFLVVEQKER